MTENYGPTFKPNPEREYSREVAGTVYDRIPVLTPLVQIGGDLHKVIQDTAAQHFQEGDILVLSEKMVGITQERVVHQSEIKVSWLAKLIAKFVVKYPDDVGWENPMKVQVAIKQVGYPRTILAVIVGGIMKYIFRQPGWYYRIMGRDVAAIDGFNPIAIPPFNEYALLAPAEPDKVSTELEKKFGVPVAIVDASNITTHILGRSEDFPYTESEFIDIVEGNPMGQGDEQTPMLIIRKQ